MRQNNAMSSATWQKQINALLITLHSLPRGTWSHLTDPPPSRASTWSIRSPGRESNFRLWNTAPPPHIGRIDFALDAAGWDPSAVDVLSTTLTTFADVFSSSKLNYSECSLRPFEIEVPPGTQPIQSLPYRLNPVLSKQADAILDSYLVAGLIQHSTSPWLSPLCASRRNRVASELQSATKNYPRSPRFLRLRSPASTRCLTPSTAARFSPCSIFCRGLLS